MSDFYNPMDCSTPGFPVHYQLPEPAYSNSSPSCQWRHPTISSSATPYFCLQSFPASGSFPRSQFFASGGQSIGVSASASVLPINIQDSFLLGLTGLISLQSKGLSRVFSNFSNSSKASILQRLAFFIVQLSHLYMITGKTIALTRWTFVSKVLSLLFNMLSRLVIAFLPRSKHLLISWLQSPTALILEPEKIKSLAVSIVFPSICYKVMGLDAMIFVFWMLTFKPPFLLSSFTFIKRLFSSSLLYAIYLWELRWCQGTEARSASVPNRMFLGVYVSDLWKYNLSPSKQGGIMSYNHSISTYIPQPEEKRALCVPVSHSWSQLVT